MHETDLRWRLRQLPAERELSRDLWPDIEARLRAPARRRSPWLAGLATAAGLFVAVGLAWSLHTPAPAPAHVDLRAEVVRREAEALTRDYQGALRQFDGAPVPAPLAPALATLDRSAVDIRAALASDPDAVFLLDQLRRTYSRRLQLTRLAATG